MSVKNISELSDKVSESSRRAGLPLKDADLIGIAAYICNKWKNNPAITLVWVTPSSFETHLLATRHNYAERQSMGSGRRAITVRLNKLDSDIDHATKAVRAYLAHKYETEKAAVAHYGKFGIANTTKGYLLPADRNLRSLALRLMAEAIASEGFGTENYGTSFWTSLTTEYDALNTQATQVDGEVSGRVSTKKQQMKHIREVLNALMIILKGNYPKTYKGVLREWGFQKEKY